MAEVDVQALSGGRAGRQWTARRFRIGNVTPRAARRLAVIESCRRACAALERRAAVDDRRLRCALLALVDEAGIVAEHLRQGQDGVACQLRAAGAHRRADAAYRRAGRL